MKIMKTSKHYTKVIKCWRSSPTTCTQTYEHGTAEPYNPPDVKQYYKQIYFQSIDSAVVTIENCFEQKDYKTYSTLEQHMIKAATKKDYLQELNKAVSFYGPDLNFKLNLSYLDKWKLQSVAIICNSVTFINIFNLCCQHIYLSYHKYLCL